MLPRRTVAALAIAVAGAAAACSAVPAGTAPAGPPAASSDPGQLEPDAGLTGSSRPARTPASRPSARRPSPVGRSTRGTARPAPSRTASRGTVVVLDPGHNGGNAAHPEIIDELVPAGFGQYKPCNTTGTASADGYSEHAYNWDVALRARALLAARGVTVLLTRDSDTGVGPCVNQRALFGNAHHATLVVAIHADGHVGGHGFHVIEASRPPAGAAVAAASHRLAVAVHDRFAAGSGFAPSTYVGSGGYDRRDDLAGLNLSLRPAIFLECGNMLDAGDAARMEAAAGRQRAAAALAAGILAYLSG